MRIPLPSPRLALLALCTVLQLCAYQPARAAIPIPTRQTNDPAPVLPSASDALSRRVFLPAIARGPAIARAPSARVSAIELTQATQNAAQSVPMVAKRPTVARVFLQSNVSLSGLTVTLSATRGGVSLAGSPLRRTGVAARVSPNRAVVGDSANFLLPSSWLSGNVVLTARVVEGGATLARTIGFQTVAPLRVTIVPIRYIHAPTGKTYEPPASFTFPASVQRMFPIPNVEIYMHAAVTFRGDVTAGAGNPLDSWSDLLDVLLSLKSSDGAAPDIVYVGMLPSTIANDNRIYYSGIGSSLRATVNFDMQLTPAHELGHALARAHAPCGGATGVDPSYPYANASIGVLGFDTTKMVLYDPGVTTDLMSYCSEWISDYNYLGMYQNQRAALAAENPAEVDGALIVPAPAAVTDGVLVRARLSPGEAANILPVYVMRAPLTLGRQPPADSPMITVAFVDGAGATLASHDVPVAAADEEGLSIRVLNAVVPLPPGSAAAVELREGATVLASRPLHAAFQVEGTAAVAVTADALQVTLPAGTPQLVRLDQGGRMTTLALDTTGADLSLPLAGLPGGAGALEVIPADVLPQPGFAAASAPASFNLVDAPPVVWISPPEAPAMGGGVVIAGYASDPEDGMLQNQWFLDGQPVAQGPILQLEQLGDLQAQSSVELRAADSAGHVVSATLLLQPLAAMPAQP